MTKFSIDGITEEQKKFLESDRLQFAIFIHEDGAMLSLKFKETVAVQKKPKPIIKKDLPPMEEVSASV